MVVAAALVVAIAAAVVVAVPVAVAVAVGVAVIKWLLLLLLPLLQSKHQSRSSNHQKQWQISFQHCKTNAIRDHMPTNSKWLIYQLTAIITAVAQTHESNPNHIRQFPLTWLMYHLAQRIIVAVTYYLQQLVCWFMVITVMSQAVSTFQCQTSQSRRQKATKKVMLETSKNGKMATAD